MAETARFNPKHLRLVERQLVPDEEIGWIGRPSAMFYTLQDLHGLVWIPLSFMVVAGFLRLTASEKSGIANREQIIAGLFAVGLGILGLIVLVNFAYAWRTIYVVTNQRAIILEPYFAGFGQRTTHSYGYHTMGVIECQPMLGMSVGNVIFKRTHIGFQREYMGKSQPRSVVDQIGFFAVHDACKLTQAMSQYIFVQ